jgi:nitrite reductase (NO-forming)
MSRFRMFSAVSAVSALVLCSALPAAARSEATVVNVIAGKSGYSFTLSKSSVPHGAITFKVKNAGGFPHSFKLCSSPSAGKANSCAGKGTPMIAPGASATLTVTVARKGSYEYLCTVPGHAANGMKGILKVT